ncbi:MAG: hypothetical protein IKC45_02695 [Clostridia bacterium]|nr:hypothetical protein [Clostridia bacterium]
MKKIIPALFICVLVMIFSACGKDEIKIEDYEWHLRTAANINAENLVVAVGEKNEAYPDAKIVDVVLTAKDGELVITDKTNDESYVGAYEEMFITDSSEDYKIIMKGKDGYATVAYTTYADGTKELTLPITVGGYDMYFYANS